MLLYFCFVTLRLVQDLNLSNMYHIVECMYTYNFYTTLYKNHFGVKGKKIGTKVIHTQYRQIIIIQEKTYRILIKQYLTLYFPFLEEYR